jgi:hypothetical protein
VDDGEETIPSGSNIVADIDLAGEEAVGNAEKTISSDSNMVAESCSRAKREGMYAHRGRTTTH